MGLHRDDPYTFGYGKYRSTPNYTPLYGLRLFLSECGYILTFIAIAAYTLVGVNLYTIELSETGNMFCLVGLASAILLAVGGLFVLLASTIQELPGIFMFFGLLLMFFSSIGFIASALSTLIAETGLLGIVQGMFELFFLGSLAALLIPMMISCLNKRTSPALGYIPTVALLFASFLLLVRSISTFATLSSALGLDFNWDAAEDLASEIRWVLRNVPTTSKNASQMYYARMFERIVLVLLMFSTLPLLFRFASFFKQYNMQMDISAELPGNQPPQVSGREKRRDREREKKQSDVLAGLSSLRKKPGQEAQAYPEDEPDDEQDELPHDNSYYGPGFISGFDEPDEYDASYVQRRPVYMQPQRKPVQPAVVYNMNPLDADYGKPCAPQAVSDEDTEKDTPQRTSSGAYKVKLRSSVPDPKDKSIWDNYED